MIMYKYDCGWRSEAQPYRSQRTKVRLRPITLRLLSPTLSRLVSTTRL